MNARWASALLAAAVTVMPACGMVPHERDDVTVQKRAAEPEEVRAVLERYREVRETAADLLDSTPLSIVETGSMLAIDSGSFAVAQRTGADRPETARTDAVDTVIAPRFTSYPLWFAAVVRDERSKVNRVQVFERASATAPWLLVTSPQTVADTALPDVRRGPGNLAVPVDPADGIGMSMSAQEAARTYAAALADARDEANRRVTQDSFIAQMRAAAEQNARLPNVRYAQGWAAEDVRHVVRTVDGGALAFVDLLRQDTYEVEEGLTVTWPDDSPQAALLSDGISNAGTLRYIHQVLLYLPGNGGKPRALGQYGGVVAGEGD